MLDFGLVMLLGFLGSFGHCVGMCGPLTVAFSLPQQPGTKTSFSQQLYYHSVLNLARITSYVLVGAGIGAIGSVLIAGGQFAGIDSHLRHGFAIVTGILLIWMGLFQISPQRFPKIPYFHPLLQGGLHERLSNAMSHLARQPSWLTPALLGLTWGFMPCGFLYAAQVKAVETGDLWKGAMTMLAFGLGTLPSMVGIGLFTSMMSRDRRSQLFRLGGWVMLVIGCITLLRTDVMFHDLTGYASLVCLMLALIARPISRLWPAPLQYRRILGVSAFGFAIAHILQMVEHTLNWNLAAIAFMLPQQQWALWAGIVSVILMLPPALTSFDGMMAILGSTWRRIHLLAVPALMLAVAHIVGLGSHYFGSLSTNGINSLCVTLLVGVTLLVLFVRQSWFWSLLSLRKFYASSQPFK